MRRRNYKRIVMGAGAVVLVLLTLGVSLVRFGGVKLGGGGEIEAGEEVSEEVSREISAAEKVEEIAPEEGGETIEIEEMAEIEAEPSAGEILGASEEEASELLEKKTLLVLSDAEPETEGEIEDLGGGAYKVSFENEAETEAALKEFYMDEAVESVAVDMEMEILEEMDTLAATSVAWGVASTGLDTYTGKLNANGGEEVSVAVLDTGIKRTHEVFSYKTTGDRVSMTNAYDFVNGDSDPADDNGHGTLVSGIVAESTSKDIKIVPVKVVGSNGRADVSTVIQGLNFVAGKVDIVNLSLGMANNELLSSVRAYMETVLAKVKKAGTIIVASSGNDGKSSVYYPANSAYTVAVGSVGRDKKLSSFSNYGPEIDFTAPGQDLTLPWYKGTKGYVSGRGTSFASPFVAAAAAMIKSEYPKYNYDTIMKVLRKNADDLGESGRDNKYGYGSLNFYKSMFTEGEAVDTDETPPVISGGIKTSDITTSSMTVSITTRDGGTGLSKVVWYYKGAGETEYKTATDGFSGETNLTTKSRTLKGLAAGKNYSVYAVVYDKTGNKTVAPTITAATAKKSATAVTASGGQVIADGVYMISTAMSNSKVIDISGAAVGNSANAQIYASNGSLAQRFIITYLNNGYYKIENYRSGKVLDVAGGSKKSGANVWQYAWNGSAAQQWKLVKYGDGSYSMVARVSGMYLDIAGGSTRNGANVQVYKGNSSKAQKFKLAKLENVPGRTLADGTYTVRPSKNTGYALDIAGGSKKNGGNLQLYKSNGTAAQKFKFVYLKNGFYRIINVNSGKVLDAYNYGTKNGTNAQQWASSGVTAQQWRIVKNSDGSYTLRARCSNLVLDVAGGAMRNGANVQTWTSNGTAAQKFVIK